MHPVIRIASLIVAALLLPHLQPVGLMAAAAILAAFFAALGASHLRGALRVLYRIRILLISIAVVYFWFTPGEAVLPALGAFSPTLSGLREGLVRAAALALLVMAVRLTMDATSREELVGGLRWWLRPFAVVGVDADRVALRIVLTLEAVPRLRGLVAERPVLRGAAPVARMADFAGSVFVTALSEAEAQPCGEVTIPDLGAPALLQWLWPLSLSLLFIYL